MAYTCLLGHVQRNEITGRNNTATSKILFLDRPKLAAGQKSLNRSRVAKINQSILEQQQRFLENTTLSNFK